jgi:hypothetical protein
MNISPTIDRIRDLDDTAAITAAAFKSDVVIYTASGYHSVQSNDDSVPVADESRLERRESRVCR